MVVTRNKSGEGMRKYTRINLNWLFKHLFFIDFDLM